MFVKFKLYLGGVEEEPIVIEALTYEDALSMSEDIFGDRVARLEKLDEIQDTTVDLVRDSCRR